MSNEVSLSYPIAHFENFSIDTLKMADIMGLADYSRNSTVKAFLELLTHNFNVTSCNLLVTLPTVQTTNDERQLSLSVRRSAPIVISKVTSAFIQGKHANYKEMF